MNKKFLVMLGIGAIALLYLFNVSYAVDNYGIVKGNASIHVLAQSGSSGTGSGSGSGGNYSLPCKTVNREPVVFPPEGDHCHTLYKSITLSWYCEYFGKGGECHIGHSYTEWECSGLLLYYDYSDTDWTEYSCIF